MGLLEGKKALIFGVANKDSIAWGIAQALAREGATLGFSYGDERLERRVRPLADSINQGSFIELCDVTRDDHLDTIFEKFGQQFGSLDILVHSVAYSPKEDLGGRFSDMSRAGFMLTLDVSAYSLVAMAKRARPLMKDGGSIIAMTFYAAQKVVPRYNSMAIAKAALEASVRYLAFDLGQEQIRVNAISAGAIRTLAAGGISGFRQLLKASEYSSPLHRLVTQDEVGELAAFLSCDRARSITGEIIYLDAGYHIVGGYIAGDQDEDEGG
jgi:enoyl-[acyl-carrier protein] reductase I